MKRKFTLLLILSITFLNTVFAQWPPCTNGTQQTCKCSTAPLLCTIDQLDNYSFDMTNYQHPGDGPSPICPGTGTVTNNPTWFAFTAWCTNLELLVHLSGCTGVGGSTGGQIAIFSGCSPYVPVACDVNNCGSVADKTLTMTGLVIGGTYYFMIDGCSGSYCHVDIDVVGTCGNAVIAPWPGPITGPTVICHPGSVNYTTPKPAGADTYHWYLNGTSIYLGPNSTIPINWSTPGTYQLCVDALNDPCVPESDPPAPQCLTINVYAANAGTITANTPVCPNAPVNYSVAGFQAGPEYTQVLLIVNSSGQVVEINPNTSGTFTWPTCATFSIYSYNYVTSGDSPVPSVGMNINTINCNTAHCCDLKSKTISFVDNQAPTFINPPANQTLVCYDLLTPIADLSYNDNCIPSGSVSGTETGMANLCNGGVLTRHWTKTDDCGNTVNYNQTITITAAPQANFINPPANQTVSCANIPTMTPNLDYTNNGVGGCLTAGSAVPMVSGTADLCGGVITNTWSFVDQCGMTKTHVQTITATPVPAAAFVNPPANQMVDCSNLPGPPPSLNYTNGLTGNCAIMGSVAPTTAGTVDICGGSLTNTWTFTDACGRTITHNQTINATPVPQASFQNPPANQIVSCVNIPASFPDLNYTNGLTGPCLIQGTASPTISGSADLCGGVITATWTFTDICGRTKTYVQTITVTPVPPAAFTSNPANQTVSCSNIPVLPPPPLNYTNNLSGACSIAGSVNAIITGSADLCGGNIVYTYTFTDVCGRTINYVQTITATQVPIAVFGNPPANIVVDCENIPLSAPDLSFTNGLTGNCAITGTIPAVLQGSPNTCGGTYQYTWTFTDACNRTITHAQNVTVNPTPVASFINPPANVSVGCNNVNLNPSDLSFSNNKIGNCNISGTVTSQVTTFYDACGGTVFNTWFYTDQCSRTITNVQTQNVAPAPSPVFLNPPANITVSCTGVPPANMLLNYSNSQTGVCQIAGGVLPSETGSYDGCGGTIFHTWDFTDACNKSITYTQKITVLAAPLPAFVNPPANITITCDQADLLNITPLLNYTNGMSGVCQNTGSVEAVMTGFFNSCGGTITFTWTLDACSTPVKHVQKVTVTAAPEPHFFNPPPDITLACGIPFPTPGNLYYTNDKNQSCDISGDAPPNYFVNGNIMTINWEYINPCSNKKIKYTQKITAIVKPDLMFNPPSANICLGQSYDIKKVVITDKNNTNPVITYHFATPAGPGNILNPTIVKPTVTTTYYILGTSGTGCADEKPFTVVVDTILDPGIGSNGTICFGKTGVNLFNYLSGSYYKLGVWKDPANSGIDISNPKNVSFSGIPPGSYLFNYIVPKKGNCPQDTAQIKLTLLPEVKITVLSVSCLSDLLNYNVTINTNGYTITTSIGNITPLGNNIVTIGPILVDSSLTIKATDPASGCNAIVFINPPNCNCPPVNPPISDGNKIICVGDPIPTLSVMVNGDETANWYDAAFGGTLLKSGSLTFKPNVSAAGIYQYYVEAKSTLFDNCVSATKTLVQLEIVAGPAVNNAQLFACDSDGNGHASFDLVSSQNQINPNPGLSFNFYLTQADANTEKNALATTYTNTSTPQQTLYAVVKNSTGCKSQATLKLNVYPKININTVLKPETCLGDKDGSITVNITGGTSSVEYSIDNTTWISTNIFNNLIAGNYTVYVRDTANCQATKAVNIIEGLSLSNDNFTIICNNAGTDSDGSDDYYVMNFNIGNNKANVGTFNVSDGTTNLGSFSYGTAHSLNIPALGQTLVITFKDVTTNCLITQTIGPLITCSTNCKITVTTFTKLCSDNGTDTDPVDDYYTITINATVVNGGPSNTFNVIIGGVTIGSYTYGVGGTFTLPADGSTVSISIFDADDGQCQTTKSTGSLIPCSSVCKLNPVVTNIICDDKGTVNDLSDDTWTYEITVTGVNTTTGWYINGTPGTIYNYNQLIKFGPVLISNGDVNIILLDQNDPTCTKSLTVNAPPPCSIPCILDITNLIVGPCNNNNTGPITTDDYFDISFTVNAPSGVVTQYIVSWNGKQWGPFNYGDDITINNLPADGSQIQLSITDPANIGCLKTIDLSKPSCSGCTQTVDAGPPFNLDCIIKSATLQGFSSDPGQVVWTGPNNYNETILKPVADVPGTYLLTVTYPDNCVAIDSTHITIDAGVPVADAGSDQQLTCLITSVLLDGNGSSKGPNLTYKWTDASGNVLGTGLTLTVTQPGSYYLQVIDPVNNCTSPLSLVSVTQYINVPTAPIFADPGEILNCNVDAIKLYTTQQANVKFTWNQNGINTQGLQIIVSKAGLVTLTALDTVSGCSFQSSIVIKELIEYPLVDVKIPERLNCKNTSVVLDATNSQDGPNILFKWYDASFTQIIGQNADTLLVNTAGTYYFEAKDTSIGCTNIDTVLVISDSKYPVIDAGPDINLPCQVNNTTLNAVLQGNITEHDINWTTKVGAISNGAKTLTPDIVGGGFYYISVVNLLSQCESDDSLYVKTNFDKPVVEVMQIDSIRCKGEQNGRIQITKTTGGTPPISYEFNGKPTNNTGLFAPLSAGTYVITMIDANGCRSDTTINIREGHLLEVLITPSILLNLGDSAVLEAIVNIPYDDISSIIWTPSDNLSCDSCFITQVIAINTQQYKISVVDKVGCRAHDFIFVVVKKEKHIFVPNVFSPNSDGFNDYFTLYGDKNVKKINEVSIFDRWGGMMFYKQNFDPNIENLGWDGKTKGLPVVEGVYVYYFKVEFIDGTEEIVKGDITVLR